MMAADAAALAEAQDPGSIWRVDYNATVAKDAAMGWQGMGLVLGLNTCMLAVALLIFQTCARSTRFSLFHFSTMPGGKSKSKAKTTTDGISSTSSKKLVSAPTLTPKAPHAFTLAKWAELLWRTPIRGTRVEAMLGPEGTFYLLYQLYAFKFLCALTAMATLVLLPLYLGIGVVAEYAQAVIRSEENGTPFVLPDDLTATAAPASSSLAGSASDGGGGAIDAHWWSFVHATIRVVPNESLYLWIPVGSTYAFTIAFGVFYYKLSQLSRIPRPLSSSASGTSSFKSKTMDAGASAATVVSTVTAAAAIASAAASAETTAVSTDPSVDTAKTNAADAADAIEAQSKSQSAAPPPVASSQAPPASASTSGHLIGMQPSSISYRSLFIDRGLPKNLREDRMLYLMDEVFPGYVEDVAMVYNLGEFHALQHRRRAEETKLERAKILHDRELVGERAPFSLRILPGSMQFPSLPLVLKKMLCCWREPPYDATVHELEVRIEKLREQESACLARILKENRGAGRAFIIFKSPRLRARFVRRVRNRSITSILARFPEHAQHRLIKYVRELSLTRWHMSAAPEPDDLDWQNVSIPFAKRTIQVLFVNAAILTLLLLFTSPIAVTSAISNGNSYSTNAARSLSDVVARVNQWVQQFSPQMARLMANYFPTLILVMINAVLLNVIHHAGRIQPLSTDSAKERMVLRSASIYLLFNTIFVPSLAFVSIDAVLLYLENEGELLDMLGALFLRNSGIFYVDYVLQRAFLGTAVVLLRSSEFFKFSWEKPRALTPREHVQAVEAWPFFTGTQSAMQISMLTVVLLFSTVVPLILPLGALYFGMQHAVDKYSLLRVRRRIKGRGSIARTATHATMVSLLLYQAGMSGYFLIRGTSAQSSSVLVLLMVTYIVALWRYIQDKERAGEFITRGGSYSYLDQASIPVQEPLPLVEEAEEEAQEQEAEVAEVEKQQPEDEDGELAPLLVKSGHSGVDVPLHDVVGGPHSGDKALRLSDLDGDDLEDGKENEAAAKPSSSKTSLRASESTPLTVFGSFPLVATGMDADSSDLYREPALRRAVRMSFGPRDVGDYGTWGASAVV